ncbi:hypothetical protein GCM10028832_20130 [Streptomyces sparsus]
MRPKSEPLAGEIPGNAGGKEVPRRDEGPDGGTNGGTADGCRTAVPGGARQDESARPCRRRAAQAKSDVSRSKANGSGSGTGLPNERERAWL